VRTIRRLECGGTAAGPRSSSVRQLADALGLDEEEHAALIAAVRSSAFTSPVTTAEFSQVASVSVLDTTTNFCEPFISPVTGSFESAVGQYSANSS
jgi:hypothetical protein